MQHSEIFTDRDRSEFARLQSEVRAGLERGRPSSKAVLQSARAMGRIRERGYHRMAGGTAPAFEGWLDAECGVKPHQTNKYLQVQDLTDEECADRHLGIESMYQVKLAPEGLRPTMWELGEQYSSGALAVGRRRAAALAASGRLEEARRVLVAATRAQQEREDQKTAARRVSQRAVWERAEAALDQAERALERMVAGAEPVPAESARRVRERLGRLGRLGERLGPAEPARPSAQSAEVADVPNVPDEAAQVADVLNVPDEVAQVADVLNVPDAATQPADVPHVPDEAARVADVLNVSDEAARVADVPHVPDATTQPADVPHVPDEPALSATAAACQPFLEALPRQPLARRCDLTLPLYHIVQGAPPAAHLPQLTSLTQEIGPPAARRSWLQALGAASWAVRGVVALDSILLLGAPGSQVWLEKLAAGGAATSTAAWPPPLRCALERAIAPSADTHDPDG